MKGTREFQKREQIARKRLEYFEAIKDFENQEQTARKELEPFRTRSKALERD